MQQKNVSIEAFRFIFMIILCLLHIEGMIHIQNHGDLVVEFFFMLSGYFLYRSFLGNPKRSTIDFTIKRFKRFWIEYVIATVPIFFLYQRGVMSSLTWDTLLNFILHFFSDLLLVHRIGIFPNPVNGPTWYLSVLLFGGGFVHALLRKDRQLTVSIILPVICLVVYSYFFKQGCQTEIDHWEVVYGLSMPLLRGIADLGLGIMLCHLIQSKPQLIEGHQLLINITSCVSLVFIFLLFFCKNQNDAYMLLFCPIFMIGLFSPKSWLHRAFQSQIWVFLGGLSYEMLLVHMAVRAPLIFFNIYEKISTYALVLIYLSAVLLLSYLLKQVGKYIRVKLHWEQP